MQLNFTLVVARSRVLASGCDIFLPFELFCRVRGSYALCSIVCESKKF